MKKPRGYKVHGCEAPQSHASEKIGTLGRRNEQTKGWFVAGRTDGGSVMSGGSNSNASGPARATCGFILGAGGGEFLGRSESAVGGSSSAGMSFGGGRDGRIRGVGGGP